VSPFLPPLFLSSTRRGGSYNQEACEVPRRVSSAATAARGEPAKGKKKKHQIALIVLKGFLVSRDDSVVVVEDPLARLMALWQHVVKTLAYDVWTVVLLANRHFTLNVPRGLEARKKYRVLNELPRIDFVCLVV